MGVYADLINSAFRDFRVDGDPSSGIHHPTKKSVRDVFAPFADAVEAATQAVDEEGRIAALEARDFTAPNPKVPVVVATTANITLSGEQTIDGVTTSTNRVLVKDQTNAAQNGIYVSASGAWTRASDMDAAAEVDWATVFVRSGTVNGGSQWIARASAVTLGTDAIPWVQVADNEAVQDQIDAIETDLGLSLLPADAIDGMTLRGLWHTDGAKTYHNTTSLTAWISADPNALTAGLHTTLYTGSDQSARPTVTDRGILFESQNGFTVNSTNLLTQTDSFLCIFAFDLDPADVVSYTTKAVADADVGAQDMGQVMQVTADTTTTYSPDFDKVSGGAYADTVLVNGYYINNNGTWVDPSGWELWSIFGSGTEYLTCSMDRLGRVNFTLYAGSGGPQTVRTHYTDALSTSGPQIIALTKDLTHLRLWLNGHEIMAVEASALPNVTTFNGMYFNSNKRGANGTVPVNGWRWYCPAFLVAENWTWAGFRAAHDAVADYAGAPRLDLPSHAFGVITAGQSWWQGSQAVNDTWTGKNGWDGHVDNVNSSNSPEDVNITLEPLPRVRSTRDQNTNGDIAPVAIEVNTFGNKVGPSSHQTGSNETIEWGCFKHLLSDDGAFPVDWTIGSAGAGGAQLSLLSAETSPAPLVQALKSKTAAEITYYEELLQSVVTARDFHRQRGQHYSVEAFIWQQGHSDMGNANYVADFLAYYDKLNAAVKRITGQANDVVCFMPQINYSTDGIQNRTNTGECVDQQFLDIMDQRGTRPIYCIGPIYQITNFIHSYLAGYRWIGELLGKVAKRVLYDGVDWQPVRPRTFTLGADYIDIDFHVPVGPLQFATNANNVAATVVTGAVNTYGFEFTDASGGGVAITGVTLQDADTVRISLSGAPASGDTVKYTGAAARYGNLCDSDGETAFYRDQDWTVAFTTGSPTYAEGNLYDLRNWCCAFTETV